MDHTNKTLKEHLAKTKESIKKVLNDMKQQKYSKRFLQSTKQKHEKHQTTRNNQ